MTREVAPFGKLFEPNIHSQGKISVVSPEFSPAVGRTSRLTSAMRPYSRWLAFAASDPLFPFVRVVTLMQDRNDDCEGCSNKVNRVGKPLKKRAPHTAADFRKLKRIVSDAFEKGVKL
ncbi:MAG: hypothetical protein ACREQO_16925 [Candidatus Binatia bacterium]